MGQTQPFLYDAQHKDSRFPTTTFDPKAVTRASWEPKPKKPTPKGPMVSFDLHPDYHVILPHRRDNYTPLDRRTKIYITWLRRLQLALRILQLIAGIGVLVLFSLFTGVDNTTSWAMRILQAVTIAHAAYAIWHLSRDAGGRTPASSAAYQFSAIFVDTGSVVGYTLAALTVHNNAASWGIVLSNKDILPVYILAVFYTAINAGSTHVLTFFSCAWLGWMFRKITLLPPDMNPLEDNLTARPLHKRNKSSISTASIAYETDKPWLESRRNSASVCDGIPERVSVSFMHTRTESRDSGISMGSRVGSSPERKKAPLRYLPRASYPNSYASVPSRELESISPRASETLRNVAAEARRPASGSSPTNQPEQRATNAARSHRSAGSKSYAALSQPYSMGGISSDSEPEQDDTLGDILRKKGRLGVTHPKPLTSNSIPPRPLNTRRGQIDDGAQYDTVSDEYEEPPSWTSQDIANDRLQPNVQSQRYRDSSIQLDSHFDTRLPGGDEASAGPATPGGGRKVSSGNDYWLNHSAAPERRRVSGKMAEEGRAERGSRSLLSP